MCQCVAAGALASDEKCGHVLTCERGPVLLRAVQQIQAQLLVSPSHDGSALGMHHYFISNDLSFCQHVGYHQSNDLSTCWMLS